MRVFAALAAFVLSGCLGAAPLSPDGNATGPVSGHYAAPCRATSLDDACILDGLDAGEAVFWEAGDLPSFYQSPPRPDCDGTTGCLEYALAVNAAPPGSHLRVDVQVYFADPNYVRPSADVGFNGPETYVGISLIDPSGELVGSTNTMGNFGGDIFVADPAPGRWIVGIDGLLPDDLRFRLRAHVAAPDREPEAVVWPDLKILPPFEIGFIAPTATIQPGVPLPAGPPAATCMAEEYAEAVAEGLPAPVLCLRFSMGLLNAGAGGFWLTQLPVSDETQRLRADLGLADIQMQQWVCTRSGTSCEAIDRPDGLVTRWHQTHIHYHYQNAYVYDLYRVERSDGSVPDLVMQSTSGKLGLDPTNEVFEGWDRLYQLPRAMPAGKTSNGDPLGSGTRIQAGWGDIYDWNRAGNYVDFPRGANGLPLAGEYVIRGVTDPDGHVSESDEGNNAAYAYFRVSGLGTVDLLERGDGMDPWDPAKQTFDVVP